MVVHQFDGQEQGGAEWLPCAPPMWCAKFGDRWASSLIYSGHAALYQGGLNPDARNAPQTGPQAKAVLPAGLIFRSSLNQILCSYTADGGTMTHRRRQDFLPTAAP